MKKYKIDCEFWVDAQSTTYSFGGVTPVDAPLVNGTAVFWPSIVCEFIKEYGTEIKEPVTYKVGDRFRHNPTGKKAMLAGVDCTPDGVAVAFIDMEGGMLYEQPFFPKNHHLIRDNELPFGAHDAFTKIEDDK